MRCNETLKKNATYCVSKKKTVYSNTPTIGRNHRNETTTEQKYTEKNVCCFLNFYGRPISTVIILVKNTSISWVCDERLVGLVYFDHAIIWLHFGHWNMFLVPSKCCRWRTKQKKHYSIVQWFCVIFLLLLYFSIDFSLIRCKPSHLLWILGLLSILQLKINELLDYRICGQSSSSPLFGWIAWNFILLQYIQQLALIAFFFFPVITFLLFCALCGIWLRCCFAPFTWYLFYCSPSNIWHCHTIRLTRWHTV